MRLAAFAARAAKPHSFRVLVRVSRILFVLFISILISWRVLLISSLVSSIVLLIRVVISYISST